MSDIHQLTLTFVISTILLRQRATRPSSGCANVHPDGRAVIAKLLRYLGYGVKTKPVHVTYVLAIMEIEAWFLAEHTHFKRIDPRLDRGINQASLGFDPSSR